MARISRSDSIQANWPTVRRAGSFGQKTNGDVGMLLEDMVIGLEIMYDFSHAFRNGRINATLPERVLNRFCHSTPAGDS